jgi:hypothetical protein
MYWGGGAPNFSFAPVVTWAKTGPANNDQCLQYLLVDKGGCCLGVTNLPPSCADYAEILGASRPFNFQGTKFYFLRNINFESA